ncbi:MAG: sensor domain-containing protein [Kineosporiaceae bacterium]
MSPAPGRGLPAPVDALAGPRTWRALAYLAVGLVLPVLLFSVVVTALSVAVGLAVTVVGLPLLLGAALLVHGCAALERHRAAAVLERPVTATPPAAASGLLARLRAQWSAGLTWRELALLVLLFAPLYALDLAALIVWLAVLGLLTCPAWYWAIPQDFPDGSRAHGIALGWFPHGPDGRGAIGVFIGDLGTALMVAAAGLVLLAGAGLLVRAAARLHARTVAAVVGTPRDPMAAAREVLATPGPLPALTPTLVAGSHGSPTTAEADGLTA